MEKGMGMGKVLKALTNFTFGGSTHKGQSPKK